jgi:glycosyltransferase involved in cell wall biosynthesis
MIGGKLGLVRRLLALGGDVYHAHDPELLPVLLALRGRGRRIVYDAHEHLHDSLISKTYVPPRLRKATARAASAVEQAIARRCDVVVAATSGIGEQFPSSTTVVINNYPVVGEYLHPPKDLSEYEDRPPVGVYVGLLAPLRLANEMFEAADVASKAVPHGRLVVAGPCSDVDDPLSHPGVDYHGVVPAESVPLLVSGARFGVVLIAATPAYSTALPTKLFEYAAAGLPVVASRGPTALAAFVEEHACGVLADNDPDDIARAMCWLLSHPSKAFEMGQRASRLVREFYSWEREAERLVAAYRRLNK